MSFASAYVLAFCLCIKEHRIRFKVGFILGRRLAMPKWCRTNNASSMLFCFCLKLRAHRGKEVAPDTDTGQKQYAKKLDKNLSANKKK